MAILSGVLGDIEADKSGYETCSSIFDAKDAVVSCLSKPADVSVASIVCSILIIIATIGMWAWGCVYEKKAL